MFGYVIANTEIMTDEEKARYKAVYCGLCRALKMRHGQLGRMTLTYDTVFLILVLGSLYEPEECSGCERCFLHPVKRHGYIGSELYEYAADMNVALAYLKQLDNWRDEHNPLSLVYSLLLKKKYRCIKAAYPRQCETMERCISSLCKLEQEGICDPDRGAKLFGELMGELFVFREDRWAPTLRAMAGHLGEFIYIMDAAVDLPKDIKHRRFNPLYVLFKAGRGESYFKEILTILIGECTIEFDKLPLVADITIMRSILCSGVWTKYELEMGKRAKRQKETPKNEC